ERLARALAAGALLALWGGHVGWELSNAYRSAQPGDAFWWLRSFVVWSYPLWTMVESYRYYGLLRRRLALGLSDPLLTNRFFLWGIPSLGTGRAGWMARLGYLFSGRRAAAAARSPVIQVATATFGVATVTHYGFTFFAPAW